MTASLETQDYLLQALQDPTTQDRKTEWSIIMKWHKVGIDIYSIDEKDPELHSIARDIAAWAQNWASEAVWKTEQNENSLLRCKQLYLQAEALLGEI